jgi:cytochrome c peroxidase
MKATTLWAVGGFFVALSMPSLARVAAGPAPVPAQYQGEVAEDASADWSAERAALGKRLFQDRILSRNHTVSCQDCHKPELAFTDGRKTAHGMEGHVGPRNTPTVVNRALGKSQFWDGRAGTLEEQALGPIAARGEMDLSPKEAAARLAQHASYSRAFQSAFGGPPTPPRIAAAIAAYEKTIYSVDSPFDRYLAGDQSALSPEAQRGLALFGGKARCSECHSGVNFSDELYHCLGVGDDKGRGGVSGVEKQSGEFKTPTLREIALTAPYMHDGSVATLEEAVDLYDRGGTPHPNLDPKIQKLGLTATEKAELVAFMKALSGKVVEVAAVEGERPR